MIVIGDSHVRAFASKLGVYPIFVGPGKDYNFISQLNAENVVNAILSLEEIITGQDVILFFGEPDTRFALRKGWHPWNYEMIQDDIDNDALVLNCARRFVRHITGLINGIDAQFNILLPVYTININQCRYINMFNQYVISNIACNIIEINSKISNNGILGRDYQLDIIHSNSNIVNIAIQDLKFKVLPPPAAIKKLIFREDFGCYCLKNEKIVTILIKKLINFIKRLV